MLDTLLSPMLLFFALGAAAALARSDLALPEQIAKGISIYLMLAIGFKGGVNLVEQPISLDIAYALLAGVGLSFGLPYLAFASLRIGSNLSSLDAAAVAGHYGSISMVTFITAMQTLTSLGIDFDGYMIAVAAAMEAPAIISALLLAQRYAGTSTRRKGLWREVFLNGSIVLLIGAFAIGMITGEDGMVRLAPLIVAPFQGLLCLFLLDMGVITGRNLRQARSVLTLPMLAFGVYMPIMAALIAAAFAWLLGMSVGNAMLFIVLAASASYIVVPAAMRLALPKANPAVYLSLAMGVTFPLNLSVGIPLWLALAELLQ